MNLSSKKRRKLGKSFLILPLILFAGCAIGPKYRDPAMELPQSYRSFESIAQGESMANLPWWKIFNDSVLQELIREALLNNYDLRIASSRVEESRALWKIARAEIFPQIDLTGSASRSRNSRETFPLSKKIESDYATGFDSTWEMDVWGRIRQSIQVAKSEYLASEEARRGVIVTLVGDVTQSYFKILELDLELAIANDTMKTRSETLDLFEKRLKGGAASSLEVAQAEADYQETASNIPVLSQQIAIEENHLSFLLGRNPGKVARGSELLKESIPPAVPSTGLPSELLKRRPDILQAEMLLRAANAQVGVQVTEFMPRIDLNNFVGGSAHELGEVLSSEGFAWTIGGEFDLPVFKGGKNVNAYNAAKAKWKESVASYKKTVINAFREVGDSITSTQKLREVREEQEKQVEALKEAARLSLLRYDGGLSSYLEVLDADRHYYTAQLGLARTIGSQWQVLIQLYRALGGGWQLEESSKK